jgi:ornithine cyclodeaminase
MLNLDSRAVASALPYRPLIDALKIAFASDVEAPVRSHHIIPVPAGTDGNLLLMPAWQSGGSVGVKLVTVFPDNAQKGVPAVCGTYILMSADTGVPLATLDGSELTLRRPAAAFALASSYLSRDDARSFLMVGTGNLAPHLVMAHTAVRPIEHVTIWGRRPEAADDLASSLSGGNFEVSVTDNLKAAAGEADIISCATLTTDPLIKGEWLHDGQHLDLVGAFTPEMRETNTEALRRAAIYVDTRAGAFSEAGEIVQAMAKGAISEDDVRAELRDLCSGGAEGRQSPDQLTLFKSVGTALEDLAAAELALKNYEKS